MGGLLVDITSLPGSSIVSGLVNFTASDMVLVTVTDPPVGSATDIYVWDIGFSTKRHDKNTDLRIVVDIHSGTTDSQGVFQSGWIKGLANDTYTAEVVDLALAGFDWAHSTSSIPLSTTKTPMAKACQTTCSRCWVSAVGVALAALAGATSPRSAAGSHHHGSFIVSTGYQHLG